MSAEEETKPKSSKEIALEIQKAKAESKRLNQMLDQAKKAEAKKAEAKKVKSSKKTKGKLHKTPSMCPTDSDSTSRSRSKIPSGVKT